MSITLHTKYLYTFSIITPIIMSGAERIELDFRTQSLNGIFRWWYRFWKAIEVKNLEELKRKEGEIWGSQEKAKEFRLKITRMPDNEIEAFLRMNDGSNRNIKRKAFSTGEFQVIFDSIAGIKNEKELITTLYFLAFFGGVGARWRRGFGSVMLNEITFSASTLEEIKEVIRSKLNLNLQIQPSSDERFDKFMNLRTTTIYLIKPKNNFWNDWQTAMDDLRDNFYRKLKENLGLLSIGSTKPKREASPLIIQIKKFQDGNQCFGILLVYEGWEEYQKFVNLISGNTFNFDIKKLELISRR